MAEQTAPVDSSGMGSVDAPRTLAQLLDDLPKVELHCHVKGTMRPETFVELARANGRRLPADDPHDLYKYTSLDDFLSIFGSCRGALRRRVTGLVSRTNR